MAIILVVEDHLVTQRVISKRLRDAGHTVETATNGLEALQRLEEMQIDLVMSDIAMPDMDGLALLRHVRSETRYANLPFVILTTSVLDQQRYEAREQGANGFLQKPVSSWELQTLVDSLLEQEP